MDLQQLQAAGAAEIIQTAGGEIQVLHATPEQVAQLQQAHQIQILQGDGQVLVSRIFPSFLIISGIPCLNLDIFVLWKDIVKCGTGSQVKLANVATR